MVLICFLSSDCKKPYKTHTFCNIFHRSTYRSTPGDGRKGHPAGQLVTTKVRTPKCKHFLGKNQKVVCVFKTQIVKNSIKHVFLFKQFAENDPSAARGPQTVNLCNHCSAIILQSLLCNLAYNLCYAMFLGTFCWKY